MRVQAGDALFYLIKEVVRPHVVRPHIGIRHVTGASPAGNTNRII